MKIRPDIIKLKLARPLLKVITWIADSMMTEEEQEEIVEELKLQGKIRG